MFPKKTGFVPFFGVLGGDNTPIMDCHGSLLKKITRCLSIFLSEYGFVVYIILGVRGAFCGCVVRVVWLGA